VTRVVCRLGLSDHDPGVVDRQGRAPRTAQGAQIAHHPILPEEGMRLIVLGRRLADDLAHVVEVGGNTVEATQRAQVADCSLLPEEGASDRQPVPAGLGRIRDPDDLSRVIDRGRIAGLAAQGAQVAESSGAPEKGPVDPALGGVVPVGAGGADDLSTGRSQSGTSPRGRPKYERNGGRRAWYLPRRSALGQRVDARLVLENPPSKSSMKVVAAASCGAWLIDGDRRGSCQGREGAAGEHVRGTY
jgi:hypothetical protein